MSSAKAKSPMSAGRAKKVAKEFLGSYHSWNTCCSMAVPDFLDYYDKLSSGKVVLIPHTSSQKN